MKEIWKDIDGYEGLYQVSSSGLMVSLIIIWTGLKKSWKDGRMKIDFVIFIMLEGWV